jgi:bifunctional ADP-heptose synthase (sugar kinase/adenylyltransferase)
MSKVLLLGDGIVDEYVIGEATRLCPEAPVPVIVPAAEYNSPGGAALVAAQLEALGTEVEAAYGSWSFKKRIFAGNHLVCRLDRDSCPSVAHANIESIIKNLSYTPDAIVVSDYNKGSFTPKMAQKIVRYSRAKSVPLFVDAKHNWNWYSGAEFAFPNEHEKATICDFGFVIQKLGARGCEIHGPSGSIRVSAYRKFKVVVTGAGDVFLAAFVHVYLETGDLCAAAVFANQVAGIYVGYRGAHVVAPFLKALISRTPLPVTRRKRILHSPKSNKCKQFPKKRFA